MLVFVVNGDKGIVILCCLSSITLQMYISVTFEQLNPFIGVTSGGITFTDLRGPDNASHAIIGVVAAFRRHSDIMRKQNVKATFGKDAGGGFKLVGRDLERNR